MDSNKGLLFVELLSSLLKKLVGINTYFQRENMLYNKVLRKMRESFVIFAQDILTNDFSNSSFKEIYALPFDKPENSEILQPSLAPVKDLKAKFFKNYPKFQSLIEEAKAKDPKVEDSFFACIKSFYLTTLREMKKRLPYENQLLNDIEVVFLEYFDSNKWERLGQHFSQFIEWEDFMNEVSMFKFNFDDIKKKVASKKVIISVWEEIKEDYVNMTKIAHAVIVLPYSSTPVEELFSEFKVFKTAYRNRITVENLEASLISEQAFSSEKIPIMPEMLAKYNDIWKPKIVNDIVLNTNKSNMPTEKVSDQVIGSKSVTMDVNDFIKVYQLSSQSLPQLKISFDSSQMALPLQSSQPLPYVVGSKNDNSQIKSTLKNQGIENFPGKRKADTNLVLNNHEKN